ncbi:MAG TPA: VOC family protein [Mucilaginibacter sp.]|jgi:PhnB protein
MSQINPYVGFNGRCREAMTFYKECLGGELEIQPVEGSPMEAHCPPALKHQILHSALTKNSEILLMATDMVGPGGYINGNSLALSMSCTSEDEINRLYLAFTAEGQILDPLKLQFWGALFATVTDKFGIRWMLNYDMNQKK